MYVFENKNPDICPCCGLKALAEKEDYKINDEKEVTTSNLYVCFYCGNSVLTQKMGENYKYSYQITFEESLNRVCASDIGYGFDIDNELGCDFYYEDEEIEKDKWIEIFADRLLLLRSQVEN